MSSQIYAHFFADCSFFVFDLQQLPNKQIQLSATVTATGGANKAVVWSVTSAEGESETNPVSVNASGLVTIPSDYSGDPIVITATSVYDSSVSDTAEITVL